MGLRFLAIVMVLLSCGGCATYEFNIVQPVTGDRIVGTDKETAVGIDPLDYRLRAVEGRLVMVIYNPTGDAVQLLGSRCAVVDPAGQSHPLHDRAIAGGTYIKEILPPFRPQIESPPPDFMIGVGGVWGNADRPGYIRPRGFGEYPYYPVRMDVYDDSSAYYWQWDGETDVRVTLVFSRGNTTFSHLLVFHRFKK